MSTEDIIKALVKQDSDPRIFPHGTGEIWEKPIGKPQGNGDLTQKNEDWMGFIADLWSLSLFTSQKELGFMGI